MVLCTAATIESLQLKLLEKMDVMRDANRKQNPTMECDRAQLSHRHRRPHTRAKKHSSATARTTLACTTRYSSMLDRLASVARLFLCFVGIGLLDIGPLGHQLVWASASLGSDWHDNPRALGIVLSARMPDTNSSGNTLCGSVGGRGATRALARVATSAADAHVMVRTHLLEATRDSSQRRLSVARRWRRQRCRKWWCTPVR